MLDLFDYTAMIGFTTVVFAVLAFARLGGATTITGWASPITSGQKTTEGTVSTKVPENTSGQLSITFKATTDATDPATLSYELTDQTTAGVFTLTDDTVALIVAADKYLDYEAETSHTVTVVATLKDATNALDTGTATVTIQIADVDDTPKFAHSSYTVNIPDGSTKGASVITLTATVGEDSKQGTAIATYKFDALSNGVSDFAIDHDSGAITVANELSGERSANYALVVYAEDTATPTQTGSTTVNVCVGCQNGESVLCASLLLILASVWIGIQLNK